MWIKRTTVNTKNGKKVYLQLVRSVWEDGKPKHRIIANLGREDKVRADVVDSLLKSLKRFGTHDSLDPNEIELLDTKNYGVVYVLHRVAQISGLSRFLHDISIAHDIKTTSVSPILALVYFLEMVELRCSTEFKQWLNGCHMPWLDKFSFDDILVGLELVKNRCLICKGISMLHSKIDDSDNNRRLNYVMSSRVYSLSKIPKLMHVVLTTQSDFNPISISTISNASLDSRPQSAKDNVFILDEDDIPQKLLEYVIQGQHEFIFKSSNQETLEKLGMDSKRHKKIVHEGGVFEECEEIGYREISHGHLRYVVLRPYPGRAPKLSGDVKEPRELLVVKSNMPIQSALKAYIRIGNLQNSFYSMQMPVDLIDSLMEPVDKILDIFITLKFIGIFLEFSLERALHSAYLDLTAQQALLEMSNMRIAEILTGKSSKYYHTVLNDTQKSILKALGLSPPPKITI